MSTFNMTEGAASGKVNQDGDDERNACNTKGEMIAICLVEADALGVLHDFYSRCGSKERTDVDGHVEERESRIALSCHLLVVFSLTSLATAKW